MVKSTVTGAASVERAFRQLTPGLSVPINQAGRVAMKPLLSAAKANAPTETGSLKKSLTIRQRKGVTVVGPSKSYVGPDGRKPARYAHIVEFGRAPSADGEGELQGTRFMTRAFDDSKDQIIKTFGDEIGPAIERRAAKLAAKG